jgi:Asp-tRNA(Asn)/Glu-tRNA(Gln) amidotransferase C subunit
MANQMTVEEIQAVAHLAGVRITERERASIAQVLAGFLAAVRGIPAAQTVEPLPAFSPAEENPHGR